MNYAETLYVKIWKTKGARLEAHKRLEKMNKYSNWSTSLVSLFVIIISLQSIQQFKIIDLKPEIINSLTVFLSILIIIISLIENSSNYKLNADVHHQCAKKLNRLYERLQQIKDEYKTSNEIKLEIDKIGIQYQNIMNEYTENHTQIDYNIFLLKDQENLIIKYLFSITDKTTFWQYILNIIQLCFLEVKKIFLLTKTYFLYYLIFLVPLIYLLYRFVN
jgi:hypothetical protein